MSHARSGCVLYKYQKVMLTLPFRMGLDLNFDDCRYRLAILVGGGLAQFTTNAYLAPNVQKAFGIKPIFCIDANFVLQMYTGGLPVLPILPITLFLSNNHRFLQ